LTAEELVEVQTALAVASSWGWRVAVRTNSAQRRRAASAGNSGGRPTDGGSELVRSQEFAERVCHLLLGAASAAATQRERYSDSGGSGSGSGVDSGDWTTAHRPTPMEAPVGFGLPWNRLDCA